MGTGGRVGNTLLEALPREERDRLGASFTEVVLDREHILYEQGQPIEAVHFPVSGVVSLITIMSSGATVELATVGREGFVGVPLALEADSWGNGRAIVQIDGEALMMEADSFRAEIGRAEAFRTLVFRYLQALLVQIGQAVACNRSHGIAQRASRWLLQTHDRVGEDDLRLTHEFLAAMLGVRRASVTVAAGELKERGLVDYRRGWIRILDRSGLEAASCECYKIVRDEFDRLLPPADTASPSG